MHRLAARIEWLSDAAAAVAGGATLGLTVMVASGVVARRVFNAPFLFVEELSGYVVLAIVFLGLAHTLRVGGHVRVELLINSVGGALRTALRGAAIVLAGVWAVFFLLAAMYQVSEFYTQGILSFAYLQTPLWVPGSFMVVGGLLLTLQCVALLLRLRGR
ncbi:MAG: TRAP transporter small permease [Candidatus Rokubacteria bacterium]|nr:TRAP transporter small permease [Candidatus Rokubacteria bacterium]